MLPYPVCVDFVSYPPLPDVYSDINILQNIICTNMSRDEPIHTNGIKTNKQLVLPVCSNQNIIVLK